MAASTRGAANAAGPQLRLDHARAGGGVRLAVARRAVARCRRPAGSRRRGYAAGTRRRGMPPAERPPAPGIRGSHVQYTRRAQPTVRRPRPPSVPAGTALAAGRVLSTFALDRGRRPVAARTTPRTGFCRPGCALDVRSRRSARRPGAVGGATGLRSRSRREATPTMPGWRSRPESRSARASPTPRGGSRRGRARRGRHGRRRRGRRDRRRRRRRGEEAAASRGTGRSGR